MMTTILVPVAAFRAWEAAEACAAKARITATAATLSATIATATADAAHTTWLQTLAGVIDGTTMKMLKAKQD